jgi:hypothetical protein
MLIGSGNPAGSMAGITDNESVVSYEILNMKSMEWQSTFGGSFRRASNSVRP